MRLTVDAYRRTFAPASARPTREQVIADVRAGRIRGFQRHGRWWVDNSDDSDAVTEHDLSEAWTRGKKAQA